MAKEIERKFLIDSYMWGYKGTPVIMKQAYLAIEGDKVIRVRIAKDKAFLTIKGNLSGITRDEFEYQIPVEDAIEMLKMSTSSVVEKTRYILDFEGKTWEIDVFEGDNFGLIIAEIELENEEEQFIKPEWALEEVSTDVKYYNFNLAQNPFSKWQ